MRVLVTGSRTWDDKGAIWHYLGPVAQRARVLREPLVVVHGGHRRGADRLAAEWVEAHARGGWPVTEEVHPVTPEQWRTIGLSAGPKRNQHMVSLGADQCLAFIRDNSSGASRCADMAEAARIRTFRVYYMEME